MKNFFYNKFVWTICFLSIFAVIIFFLLTYFFIEKVEIERNIKEAFSIFITLVLIYLVLWFYFFKKYLIEPINKLIYQISEHITYKDLEREIFIDTKIEEIKLLEKAFNLKNKILLDSYKKLEELSYIDSLTGIYNRRKFDEYSKFIVTDAQRYNHIFSIVVIDMNKFKLINDTYGHDIGDKVLVFFTQLIVSSIRETDFLFRMGGDEYYLLLNNTDLNEASIIVKKLEQKLLDSEFIYKNIQIIISASFGIAQYKLDGDNINQLVIIADNRMYENKKS